MTVRQTSRDAYHHIKPTLTERQQEVMFALGESYMTNTELAETLNWSINRVTPRVLELRNLGKIEEVGRRPCKITGSMALVWRAKVRDTLF